MQKTKKVHSTVPKNIQLTLITLAATAFVVQVIHHTALLIRVYPDGPRLSNFTFIMIGYALLPALLFAAAFMTTSKTLPRFDRLFHATILAIAGLGIHMIVSVLDRLMSQLTDIYTSSLFINGGMIAMPIIVTLVLFASLLYALRSRNKNTDKTNALQRTIILILGLAFIANATFSISSLVLQHIGSKDITNFITHPDFVLPVVLPLAFFATAYLALQKLNTTTRLYTSFLYAVIGVMVISITTTIFYIGGTWILSPADSATMYALDLPTIFASIISIAVYTFLIVTHNQSKKTTKKAK